MENTHLINHNFLPRQFKLTNIPQINHNYLRQQFSDYENIFKKLENLIIEGDFTLGSAVDEFEDRIKSICNTHFAIGVGSGTDAIFLSLKALGIGTDDEVITTPYTFFATIGAIVTAGARPVFVDIGADYNIDTTKIEDAITSKTKAIIPVHWAGLVCDMDSIQAIAECNNLSVVEDACHAFNSSFRGRAAGSFGDTGCFSMHPLKNLNVWGDGGFIVTNSKEIHNRLVLLRNHGLIDRDYCMEFAYNSRLDTLQAIVANYILENKLENITESRITNALFYDKALANCKQIQIPSRPEHCKHVFHLYIIRAENRDNLKEFLVKNGIDAKVHYPVPMHLQPAAKSYDYKPGDFPVAEKTCKSVISLPVHEFISKNDREYVVDKILEFYK